MELHLAETLSALLREKRLTLREVSKACGVSVSTISEWQSGRAPKNPVQVAKVASYLGVSLHKLLFGVEDANNAGPIERILKEDLFQGTFEIVLRRVNLPKDGN